MISRISIPGAALSMVCLGAAARAEPALWVVKSPTATIYLMGTMHILPKKTQWFGPKLAAAFAGSGVLMEEADVGLNNPGLLQSIMGQAMSPDYDIWSKIPPADAARFRDEVKACGLPDDAVAHFKPWFASMLPTLCPLISGADGDLAVSSSSPEATLLAKAKETKKPVDFFETAEAQIGLMANAPDDVQIKQLQEAIEDKDNTGANFTAMEASWAAGDVDALSRTVAETKVKDARFYAVTFTERNERFAARIAKLLKGAKTVFVAIGAGHLAGPDSVQAQLARVGFTASRM